MERINAFNSKGKFYKGNTHLHTTLSDGKMSPAEAVEIYKAADYDFVAVTDHWVYGRHEELAAADFLIFTGAELDIPLPREKGFTHHVTIIGDPAASKLRQGDKLDEWRKLETMNDMIAKAREAGHLCIYAHPVWSQVRHSVFNKIKGCFAVEIYNNTCHINAGTGWAESYFDEKLWEGKKIFPAASDDAHRSNECLGGFICVKSEAFTHKAILDAMKNGSFYSSTGPEIHDFYIENGTAFVECSPCDSICFYSDGSHGAAVVHDKPGTAGASWKISSKASYVYAVCTEGAFKAWTPPVWL